MSQNTYTIYSLATGDILRIISASVEILRMNLASTEGYVEGRGDSNTQMVVDEQLVSKPESVLAAADAAKVLSNALMQRHSLLIASDWTDTLSACDRLGETLYQEWQSYRQALRNITAQTGFPTEIVWPEKPT